MSVGKVRGGGQDNKKCVCVCVCLLRADIRNQGRADSQGTPL